MMNIESGGYTSFSQLPLSLLDLNCFFIEETERSSVSRILPNGQTSQKSRYHKFLIYLVVLTVVSLPFFSIKQKNYSTSGYKKPLLWASVQVRHHSSSDPMETSQCHLSKCVAWLVTFFNAIGDPTTLFHTSISCIHLVTTTLRRKHNSRFVSSRYLCEWLSSFRLQIR